MKFNEKYNDLKSTGDKPCQFVADVLETYPPDVVEVLSALDFESEKELAEAYNLAWYTIATDKYLLNKSTQTLLPHCRLLVMRAQRICTQANVSRSMNAAAEGLWLQKFERKELDRRRKVMFDVKQDSAKFEMAKERLKDIYAFTDTTLECLRYFVCQSRRDDTDPALNRSLYVWSKEKMTGKTTIAKMMGGILNGCQSWPECNRTACLSDIPTELQFGTFDRPKGTRWACVVMDEAFAGKSTAKYYGKFKAAMTTDTCPVQVKFGGTYDIKCSRNYIFTSNNDIASVVADESERRFFEIHAVNPKRVGYGELFNIWRDFIVNAPDEEDAAEWYRNTAQQVRGEVGVQKDDIVSALLGDEMRQKLTQAQQGGLYQVSFPKFFTDFLAASYDVRKIPVIIKEAIVEAYGEPKESGNRKYYNINDLISQIGIGLLDGEPIIPETTSTAVDDLPW